MRKWMILIFSVLLVGAGIFTYFMVFDKHASAEKEVEVLAFGDSLTYGKGDRKEEGYVGNMEKRLNEKYKGKTFRIRNYGVPGRESGGILKELAKPKTAEELNEADYFVVFIGTNDFRNSNGGDYTHLQHDKIKEGQRHYIRNLKAIIKILKTINNDAPILVIGIYNPFPQGEKIEKYVDEWNKSTIDVIRDEKDTTYIPTNDLFKDKDKKKFFSDSLHLDKRGYKLLSDRILAEYDFNKGN